MGAGMEMANVDPVALAPGTDLGTSEWFTVTQEDITGFGRATHDMDRMHVDPAWARENGPFGGTIAFGFFTLSLLTYFSHNTMKWESLGEALNYGLNRVRFIEPVPVGARIRGVFTLKSAERRENGNELITFDCRVEIEGKEKPALIAEWLGLRLSGTATGR